MIWTEITCLRLGHDSPSVTYWRWSNVLFRCSCTNTVSSRQGQTDVRDTYTDITHYYVLLSQHALVRDMNRYVSETHTQILPTVMSGVRDTYTDTTHCYVRCQRHIQILPTVMSGVRDTYTDITHCYVMCQRHIHRCYPLLGHVSETHTQILPTVRSCYHSMLWWEIWTDRLSETHAQILLTDTITACFGGRQIRQGRTFPILIKKTKDKMLCV